MKTKLPEHRHEIVYRVDSNLVEVESVLPNYRKITFVLPEDKMQDFFDVFFRSSNKPGDDIETKKRKITQRAIASIFNDYMTMAIHTPHSGKKAWMRERNGLISKLDPMKRIFPFGWRILEKVFEDID